MSDISNDDEWIVCTNCDVSYQGYEKPFNCEKCKELIK
jgi:hypothetical protein